jgi:hypothetical protein
MFPYVNFQLPIPKLNREEREEHEAREETPISLAIFAAFAVIAG